MSTPGRLRRPSSCCRDAVIPFPYSLPDSGQELSFPTIFWCFWVCLGVFCLFVCCCFIPSGAILRNPCFSEGFLGSRASLPSRHLPPHPFPGGCRGSPGCPGFAPLSAPSRCPQPGSDPEFCMAGRSTASSHSFTPTLEQNQMFQPSRGNQTRHWRQGGSGAGSTSQALWFLLVFIVLGFFLFFLGMRGPAARGATGRMWGCSRQCGDAPGNAGCSGQCGMLQAMRDAPGNAGYSR